MANALGNIAKGAGAFAMGAGEALASHSPGYNQFKQNQARNLDIETKKMERWLKIVDNPHFSRELRETAARNVFSSQPFKILANSTGQTQYLAPDFDISGWLNEKDTGTRRTVRRGPAGQVVSTYESPETKSATTPASRAKAWESKRTLEKSYKDLLRPREKEEALIEINETRARVDLPPVTHEELMGIKKKQPAGSTVIPPRVRPPVSTAPQFGSETGGIPQMNPSQRVPEGPADPFTTAGTPRYPQANYTPPAQSGVPAPRSKEEFDKLPSKTRYTDPEGNIRIKP